MAFVMKRKSESFFYPINLAVVGDSGASSIHRFEMSFKRLSRSEVTKLQQDQADLNNAEIELNPLEQDINYILRIADGWKDVNGEDGKPLEFNRENLEALLDFWPNATGKIVEAFYESTWGGAAKRKN